MGVVFELLGEKTGGVGAGPFILEAKRIYVNTRNSQQTPFFLHHCNNYDGSILAIFPKNRALDIAELCDRLNNINWQELAFQSAMVSSFFSQRS